MDDLRKAQLKANVAALPRRVAFWVMSIAGGAGYTWERLTAEQKKRVIDLLPVDTWWLPIALTAAGVISQVWPRKAVSPDEAAAPAPAIEIPAGKDRSE